MFILESFERPGWTFHLALVKYYHLLKNEIMSAAREQSRNLIVDGPQTIKYLIYVGVCRTFPLLFLLRCESILFFQQQKKASGSACFFQLIPSLNLKASLTSSHPHLAPFFFSIKKAAAIVDKLIDANGGITRPSPCCCHCSSNVICFAVKKTHSHRN